VSAGTTKLGQGPDKVKKGTYRVKRSRYMVKREGKIGKPASEHAGYEEQPHGN